MVKLFLVINGLVVIKETNYSKNNISIFSNKLEDFSNNPDLI
jgi:hypothetical protein